jgi:hypothetical protein
MELAFCVVVDNYGKNPDTHSEYVTLIAFPR